MQRRWLLGGWGGMSGSAEAECRSPYYSVGLGLVDEKRHSAED